MSCNKLEQAIQGLILVLWFCWIYAGTEESGKRWSPHTWEKEWREEIDDLPRAPTYPLRSHLLCALTSELSPPLSHLRALTFALSPQLVIMEDEAYNIRLTLFAASKFWGQLSKASSRREDGMPFDKRDSRLVHDFNITFLSGESTTKLHGSCANSHLWKVNSCKVFVVQSGNMDHIIFNC